MTLPQQVQFNLNIKQKPIQGKALPHIFIVDDDIDLLEELKEGLSLKYNVEILSNSSQAFDTVYESKPDLMVLDIKMSPKTGFQLANEFSNFEGTKYIPIIAITGVYVEKEHPLMKLFNMKHIIIKPFSLEKIDEKIEAVLKELKLSKQKKENDEEGRLPKKRW